MTSEPGSAAFVNTEVAVTLLTSLNSERSQTSTTQSLHTSERQLHGANRPAHKHGVVPLNA